MTMKRLVSLILVIITVSTSFAQKIGGTWKGKLNAGNQKLEIVFHFTRGDGNETTCKMDVPAQGAMGIPVDIKSLTEDSVSLQVDAIRMVYNGKLTGNKISGTFNQHGMSFPLELESGEPEKLNRPQEPQKPYNYKTEEVTFVNEKANANLSGTLTYPIGYKENRKVPVVIMVTGSGAQNRDEEIFGHKPFLVIADYLARNGIASLRYDDRGTGKSVGGARKDCTSEDFAEDAEYGLQWLKKNGKFDKIGILGHSEGGMIAFMLGAENKADFIVSMAEPGIKGDSLLAEQQNAILKLKGIPANYNVESIRRDMTFQPKNPWLEYFVNYDPKYDIEKISIPVMAINGSNDVQVISKSNLKVIKEILSGKNSKNLIKEYPNLNHLFQNCTPETAFDYYNIEETISEEVLKDIASWINGL
jgi:hypothetical protein BACCOPRO_03807